MNIENRIIHSNLYFNIQWKLINLNSFRVLKITFECESIATSKKLVFFKPQNINKSGYFLKKNKKFYSQLKLCLFLFIECVADRPKMI